MYLTMRTVWLLTACCLLVIAVPRPLTVAGCAIAVALLVVGDVIAACACSALSSAPCAWETPRLPPSRWPTLDAGA